MKYNVIYVICPGGIATGGPELLHQLVYNIKLYGQEAYIVYVRHGNMKIEINPKYYEYIDSFLSVKDIVDDEKNLLIVPETKIEYLYRFKRMKKAIWWLSVDFYLDFATINGMCSKYGIIRTIYHFLRIMYYKIEIKHVDFHFYQSFYAKKYLIMRGINENVMFYLSDYINNIYIDASEQSNQNERKDIIVFNPKKGGTITEYLKCQINEYKWVPLQNMSMKEIVDLLGESKIYIDFGNHPGKDRIPREAAIMGCCIITGMEGSAGYYQDIPILSKYKFGNAYEETENIRQLICNIMQNYDIYSKDFVEYREFIKNEKQNFEKMVYEYFCK